MLIVAGVVGGVLGVVVLGAIALIVFICRRKKQKEEKSGFDHPSPPTSPPKQADSPTLEMEMVQINTSPDSTRDRSRGSGVVDSDVPSPMHGIT